MNEKQLIKFLKQLLKLQSFDPLTSKVPEFIHSTLLSFGVPSEIVDVNGYKSIVAKTNGIPRVLFNGHWDTVLPSKSMKKATQTVTEDSEFIYGLGACDMKSGVAAIVASFIDCFKEGIEGVMINLVPDEEIGGENGTKQLIAKGFNAPNVVICEPTNLNISLGQKGSLATRVTAKGISGHGAYPNRGDNAILKILNFTNELNKVIKLPVKETSNEDLFYTTTATLTTIEGGSASNVIPDTCNASFDVRIPPTENIEDVRQKLIEIAEMNNVEISFDGEAIGWEVKKDTNLFKVSDIAFKELGITTEYVRKMGTNDGRYYAATGSDIINIGPGDNKLSHTLNEKVSKEELVQAKLIYLLISKML
jgi:succinyl-diaminopimelate desuccinylase